MFQHLLVLHYYILIQLLFHLRLLMFHQLIQLLVSLCIGALCGFAANKIMNGKSKGFLRNALLGIIGGVVGGFLGNLIGIGESWISGIILTIVGSCLVVWLARKIAK